MNKKSLSVLRFFLAKLFLIFVCGAEIIAQQTTHQKIYPVDCDEYKDICNLYIVQGMAEPSGTGPWSGSELLRMLNKINPETLSDNELNLFNKVSSTLYAEPEYCIDEDFGLNIVNEFNVELYGHTNTDQFPNVSDFSYGENNTRSFFKFSAEGFVGPFSGFSSFDVRNFPGHTPKGLGETNFSTNIIAIQNFEFDMIGNVDSTFPDRAYVAAGGDNWTVQVGKDRLSQGVGVTGNLVVSDCMPFHNFARITTFSDSFKYTYLLDFFPHPVNYSDNSRSADLKGIRFYQEHRVESLFLNNRLRFYVTEAIMYQSENGYADLFVMNPINVLHSLFIDKLANSSLAVECSFSPIENWNVYGQIMIDQFAIPGEVNPKNAPQSNPQDPNALGFILGTKWSYPMKSGLYFGSFESVYTNPFLYRRDSYDNVSPNFNCDYVVALRRNSNLDTSIWYDKYFYGYPTGGDSLVFNLNSGYQVPDSYGFEANLFYMLHGTVDLNSKFQRIWSENYENYLFLSGAGGGELADGTFEARSGLSHTVDLSLKGYYQLNKHLKLFDQIDLIQIWNHHNLGRDAFDVQNIISVSYTL